MRILLAYDGSDCSKAALKDLKRAGLPFDAHCTIVSVAEVVLPVTPIPDAQGLPLAMVTYEKTGELTSYALERARWEAGEAKKELKQSFPEWQFDVVVELGSPASVLLDQAKKRDIDLIVIGSHGRSAVGRIMLGSVSHKVAHEASCSVRICRPIKEGDTECRIMVGLDKSEESQYALDEVKKRRWTNDTDIHLVSVIDLAPLSMIAYGTMALDPLLIQVEEEERKELTEYLNKSVHELQSAGLKATAYLEAGRAQTKLLEHAKAWAVDCVFVGARGLSKMEGLLLGSVSNALAVKAHCSVEIVRNKQWN